MAIAGAAEIQQRATQDMLALEKKINADAVGLIYRAECVAETTLNVKLQQAVAKALEAVAQSKPTLKILGVSVVTYVSKKVQLDNPAAVYFATQQAEFQRLSESVTDDTPAIEIIDAYRELERAARLTYCSYIDVSSGVEFISTINELKRRTHPWIEVVSVKRI